MISQAASTKAGATKTAGANALIVIPNRPDWLGRPAATAAASGAGGGAAAAAGGSDKDKKSTGSNKDKKSGDNSNKQSGTSATGTAADGTAAGASAGTAKKNVKLKSKTKLENEDDKLSDAELWAKYAPKTIQNTYELVKLIKRSGQSNLFCAKQKGILFAVKLYHASGKETELRIERDRRAYREVMILKHLQATKYKYAPAIIDTNIAKMDDARTGQPYAVLEFIDGTTLDNIINRWFQSKTAPPEHVKYAVGLAKSLCKILQSLHRRGVRHRDLKPDNIMVTRDDSVILIDYGLAYAGTADADDDTLEIDLLLEDFDTTIKTTILNGFYRSGMLVALRGNEKTMSPAVLARERAGRRCFGIDAGGIAAIFLYALTKVEAEDRVDNEGFMPHQRASYHSGYELVLDELGGALKSAIVCVFDVAFHTYPPQLSVAAVEKAIIAVENSFAPRIDLSTLLSELIISPHKEFSPKKIADQFAKAKTAFEAAKAALKGNNELGGTWEGSVGTFWHDKSTDSGTNRDNFILPDKRFIQVDSKFVLTTSEIIFSVIVNGSLRNVYRRQILDMHRQRYDFRDEYLEAFLYALQDSVNEAKEAPQQ